MANEHRAQAAADRLLCATLLSEKEQPGSFWLNELAEFFESGYQDRVLVQVSNRQPCCQDGLGPTPPPRRCPVHL